MTAVGLDHDDEIGRVLFEVATPLVYRQNAFRVTGVAVTATGREARRYVHWSRLRAETGLVHGDGAPSGLALQPPPDRETVERAIEALGDPTRRLVEELFWVWPPGAGTRAGDAVAAHDAGVLSHAQALDIELGYREGPVDELWKEAYAGWAAAAESPAFWERLDDRVRELADPRLTPATTRRLRADLPRALLSIQAQLALSAAEAGDGVTADRHVGIMRSSPFAVTDVDAALHIALASTVDRLRALRERCEHDAAASPDVADTAARRLLDQAGRALTVVDALLPDGEPHRGGVHDEVALGALDCTYAYLKATKDWDGTRTLLRAALELAVGEAAQVRIYRHNLIWVECWLCKARGRGHGTPIEVPMHGDVSREAVGGGTSVRWQVKTVNVPRCQACVAMEQRGAAFRSGVARTTATLFVVAVAAAVVLLLTMHTSLLVVVVMPLAAVLAFRVAVCIVEKRLVSQCRIDPPGRASFVGGESHDQLAERFPAVVSTLEDPEWAFGQEPLADHAGVSSDTELEP